MWSRALVVAGGLGCYGYWSRLPDEEESLAPLIESSVPLVFIPGLKGSVLVDPLTNLTHFVTGKQSMGAQWNLDMSLPCRWLPHGRQATDGLEATRVLRSVCVVRSLCWKVYDDVVTWGQQHLTRGARPFATYAYDWRRDLVENQELFAQFLEEVSQRHGGQRVQVLAHSMGGVLTLATLHQRPELFHSVLFVGVPFGCGVGYLQDITLGSPLGYNLAAFSPAVLFSFGSSYWTFPHAGEPSPAHCGLFEYSPDRAWRPSAYAGRDFSSPSLLDTLGRKPPPTPDPVPTEEEWALERCAVDLYRAEDWVRYKLGVFGSASPPAWEGAELEEKLAYLQRALDRGQELRQMLQYREDLEYPPLTVLSGDRYPTLVTLLRHGPLAVGEWDYASAPKIAGDGRIPYDQSYPDARIPCRKEITPLHHQMQLNDVTLLQQLLLELLHRTPSTSPSNS